MAKRIRSLVTVTVLLIVGLSVTLVVMLTTFHRVRANPGIIYVDGDAPGPTHDGSSWTTAFTNVQAALAAAVSSDEIWVAEGVYTPGSADQRDATFTLKNGVALYGGFAATETLRTERDWTANITVLSGDIDQNDITDPHGVVTTTTNIVGNNAYHVVTGGGTDNTAMLDGFTLSAGRANGSSPNDLGGGMYNDPGSPTLSHVTFSGNSAAGHGGGMYNNSSSPTLSHVTFSGNSAYYGGGISINAYAGHTSVLNSVISNNFAAINGGGIYCAGSLTVDSSTVSGNAATNYGGGIWNNGTLTIQNNTTIGGAGAGNTAGTGGGVYNNGNLTVNASAISSNEATADHGGGIYTDTSGTTTVKASLVILNHTWSGGGLFNKGMLIVQNGSIVGGTGMGNSVDYDGGGIYNDDGGTTTVDASTVSHNTASYGGGIFNGGILVVQNASLVSANTAVYGGGIHNGGGYNSYYGNTTVDTSTISANSAYLGGGIWSQGTLTILNSLIAANTASYYGGGNGGGIYNGYGATTVTASTFSGNTAANSGGGMYNQNNSSPTLTNVTLWGNTASSGAQIYNASSTAAIAYSLIQGCGGSGAGWDSALGTDAGGNIDADPLFVDAASGNLRLQVTSPAIDAGDNAAVPVGITTDLDGNPRFVDIPTAPDTGDGMPPIVDMGAYETQVEKPWYSYQSYLPLALRNTP